MDEIASLPANDRQALFQEAANRKGLSYPVIEKDFWVCWTLRHVFGLQPLGAHLIFKGGTSLSKVFGLIDRFSEDIDLSIRRDYLGAVGDDDPEQNGISKTQSRDRIDALRTRCRLCVQDEMRPALERAFHERLGPSGELSWRLEADLDDAGTLLFTYPATRLDAAEDYVLLIAPHCNDALQERDGLLCREPPIRNLRDDVILNTFYINDGVL